MPLSPICKERAIRKITTYDFEWYPGSLTVKRDPLTGEVLDANQSIGGAGVRLCGAYDERKGYRKYKTIRDFIAGEFTADADKRWFYAHAGGLADVQFLFEELVADERYSVSASFSGSSAIICHVKRGKHVWHLIDSYWLLRDKLANIAKAVGLKKLNDYQCPNYPECGHTHKKTKEPQCIFHAPDSVLEPYNEQDCFILWKAITEFESTMLSIGGQLQKTIASTAMELFRRKYLDREIESTPDVNTIARRAYTSSRVEVFRSECEKANYFDINSSFPFSMTKPHPGSVTGRSTRIPSKLGSIYLAECSITVPDMYLPPLPYRNKDGRVYFPTGSWRGWMSNVDVELAEKRGCKIHHVHEVIHFESCTYLAGYAIDIYQRRLDAKKRGSEFESLVYKYLLNSLYGKFAESREKSTLHIRPTSMSCPHNPPHAGNTCVQVLQPGVIVITDECEIEHEWVPISVHITALSRAALEGYLYECRDSIYYCDTDSIITNHDLPTGDKLGELKLEMTIENGTFVAPKLYRIKGDEIGKGQVHKVKAKGFSRLTLDEFQSLREGVEVGIESMMRIRELMKRGHAAPMEKVFGKSYRGSTRPKRAMDPKTNNSRPWTTAEVDQKYRRPI